MDYIKLLNEKVSGRFKNLDCTGKLSRIFKVKQWKDTIKVDYIHSDTLHEICILIEHWDTIKYNNVIHIAVLCNYNDSIIDLYQNYNKLTVSEKKSRCYNTYCLYYGKEEGNRRFIEYKEKESKKSIQSSYIEKYGKEEGNRRFIEYKKGLSVSQIERYKNTDEYTKRSCSIRCVEYWMKRGNTRKESEQIISKNQSSILKQFHSTKDNSYYRQNNPMCVEYWMKRGCNENDANVMIQPFLDDFIQTKSNYINKYGDDNGCLKWDKMIDKRNKSMSDYITSEQGMYGKASKESLQYFIPLYKKIRKEYGINKDDVYFGIKGSKEWFLGHGKSYYYKYDFTIRSKKIIIEYNNTRWHPHPDILSEDEWDSWKIHGMLAQDKYDYDCIKNQTARNRGYNVLVIWNTDSFDYNTKIIQEFINEYI